MSFEHIGHKQPMSQGDSLLYLYLKATTVASYNVLYNLLDIVPMLYYSWDLIPTRFISFNHIPSAEFSSFDKVTCTFSRKCTQWWSEAKHSIFFSSMQGNGQGLQILLMISCMRHGLVTAVPVRSQCSALERMWTLQSLLKLWDFNKWKSYLWLVAANSRLYYAI